MTTTNPFLDHALIQSDLYANADRLARRTSALIGARVRGQPVADALIEIAQRHLRAAPGLDRILDVGCGRGTTTLTLAQRLTPRRLVAIDAAPAVIQTARRRLKDAGANAECVIGDFHRLPLPDKSFDLAVAAFCLYHSPSPVAAITELRRCLAPTGAAIIVTKSADSYHELDRLIAASGLDPAATTRPSLYTALHSDNVTDLTAAVLDVDEVIHEQHRFRFADLAHIAAYLATSPKYHLPIEVRGDAVALTDQLRRRLPDQSLEATSTVTYVVGSRR